MNERNNKRNSAQQVVEHLRHRALQSPQAERLAEYVANRFKTTGEPEISIGCVSCWITSTEEDWKSMGYAKQDFKDLYYKRENGRYYVRGSNKSIISDWKDVSNTIIPCKYATDQADLTEKYFILTNLGYDVKRGKQRIYIILPQVNYLHV